MSVLGDFMRDAARPALMGLLADSLQRLPAGSTTPLEVDGIWSEDDPRRVARDGDVTTRKGLLKIHPDVVVAMSDRWLIDGLQWSVETLEKIEGGFRHIRLTREERRQQKPKLVGS